MVNDGKRESLGSSTESPLPLPTVPTGQNADFELQKPISRALGLSNQGPKQQPTLESEKFNKKLCM